MLDLKEIAAKERDVQEAAFCHDRSLASLVPAVVLLLLFLSSG